MAMQVQVRAPTCCSGSDLQFSDSGCGRRGPNTCLGSARRCERWTQRLSSSAGQQLKPRRRARFGDHPAGRQKL